MLFKVRLVKSFSQIGASGKNEDVPIGTIFDVYGVSENRFVLYNSSCKSFFSLPVQYCAPV